jgi:DNA helicase HerA-like ATPase
MAYRLDLGTTEGNPFRIDTSKLATGRTLLVASTGSGKSNLISVICEELCKAKTSFILADVQGEFWMLEEKFPVMVIGDANYCQRRWNQVDPNALAQLATNGIPIILDLPAGLDNLVRGTKSCR